jgi:hypothetical protein
MGLQGLHLDQSSLTDFDAIQLARKQQTVQRLL